MIALPRKLPAILAAVLLAAIFAFSAWIAREALLPVYEPYGFTSEYDRDVSDFFPEYPAETEISLAECYRNTLGIVAGLDEGTDFFRAEIYFDSGQVRSWAFFFALKERGPFRGELTVFSSGHAAEAYAHRHFAGKPRPMRQDMAERQLNDIQREATSPAVSYAGLTAGQTCWYDSHGEPLGKRTYE